MNVDRWENYSTVEFSVAMTTMNHAPYFQSMKNPQQLSLNGG
jgi:hypothetical protein